MNELCDFCGICCKLIPVDEGNKRFLRDGFQPYSDDLEFLNRLSESEALKVDDIYVRKVLEMFPDAVFYSCKYLNSENVCTAEVNPAFCKNYPSSALAIIPDDCSCSGEIFLKNEELKKKVRQIKEEIMDYETLAITDDKEAKSYIKIVENLKKFVDKYSAFGADDW